MNYISKFNYTKNNIVWEDIETYHDELLALSKNKTIPEILKLRFHDMTIHEIGKYLQMSKSHVDKLEKRACNFIVKNKLSTKLTSLSTVE